VAPGEVRATIVALAPWLIDAGRLVIWTDRDATGTGGGATLAVVAVGVGVALTGIGVADGAAIAIP
jgi:hypothetical protein